MHQIRRRLKLRLGQLTALLKSSYLEFYELLLRCGEERKEGNGRGEIN